MKGEGRRVREQVSYQLSRVLLLWFGIPRRRERDWQREAWGKEGRSRLTLDASLEGPEAVYFALLDRGFALVDEVRNPVRRCQVDVGEDEGFHRSVWERFDHSTMQGRGRGRRLSR
jgi:hypothetical protein